jgi:hypothetical protein
VVRARFRALKRCTIQPGSDANDPLSTEKDATLDAQMAGHPNPFRHQRFPANRWSIYGAQRAQPVATGGKWKAPESRSNKPIRNRWQPTATVSQRMVRRGSTVRVRQRALLQAPHVGAFPFRATCSLSNVGMEPCLELSHSERPRRSALRHGLRTRSSYSDGTGSAPLDSHLPSVVPGRHHCRWLDHEHNGAAKGVRTVHDAARDRHPLMGTEHERFAPLYLELKPAL